MYTRVLEEISDFKRIDIYYYNIITEKSRIFCFYKKDKHDEYNFENCFKNS